MTRMRLSRRAGLLVPLALLIPALAGREWEAAALAKLPRLFDPYIKMPLALSVAVPLLARTVAKYEYCHVKAGAASPEFVDLLPNAALGDYPAEVLAQHTRSYFNFYGFQPVLPLFLDHMPLWKDLVTNGTLPADSTASALERTVFGVPKPTTTVRKPQRAPPPIPTTSSSTTTTTTEQQQQQENDSTGMTSG